MLNVELCGLGFNGNKLVAQLFGLPFKFCLQLFLPLGVSGIPNGLVISCHLPHRSRMCHNRRWKPSRGWNSECVRSGIVSRRFKEMDRPDRDGRPLGRSDLGIPGVDH